MQKREILLLQEHVFLAIRDFFTSRNFHEVYPAVLQQSIPLEPTIYPFYTDWQTSQKTQRAYLSTSPEKNLKAALAAELGNCFAFGKSFRNLEQVGPQHQPEFTMLEWYRANSNSEEIKSDVKSLFVAVKRAIDIWKQKPESNIISYQNQQIDLSDWQTISIDTFFQQKFGIGLKTLNNDSEMQQFAKKMGYDTNQSTWEQLFNQCFLNELEPTIGLLPTFVTDFPTRISPLCATQPASPFLADRFEIYFGGMELGNGNLENTDVATIEKKFQDEAKDRAINNSHSQPTDTAFLDDLIKLADKNCAGIGIGVERLLMLLTNTTEINDVTPFHLV